jgi:hypothetical protein
MGPTRRQCGSTQALAATHSNIHPRQPRTKPISDRALPVGYFLLGCEAFDNKYPALRRALSDWPNCCIGGRIVPLARFLYTVESDHNNAVWRFTLTAAPRRCSGSPTRVRFAVIA